MLCCFEGDLLDCEIEGDRDRVGWFSAVDVAVVLGSAVVDVVVDEAD